MAHQVWERLETCLPVKAYRVGGRETVGDPPANPLLEDRHWIHDGTRWGPNCGPIQEDRSHK